MGAAQRTEAAAAASTQQSCQPDIHTVLRDMGVLIAEQRVELRHTKTQLEAMQTRLIWSVQAMDLYLTVTAVSDLRREREQSRVSFSASLLAEGGGDIGPSGVDAPLVFRRVITNVANAYNLNTGAFTAPIRGVYFFVVFVYGGHASTPTGVSLYKNGEHVAIAYAHQPSYGVRASNGASLLLEEGDVVYVKLWSGALVYDNQNHHTTFSGHLLFPM
ncbi:hypothetical protein ACEWY4_003475 [Coilia grayii]|uniref:C1q domain-containing protein n=1 Tax=Coilia grayii TaxID=363190 RepID=A0ABD1KRB6_9TELE